MTKKELNLLDEILWLLYDLEDSTCYENKNIEKAIKLLEKERKCYE